MESSLRIGIHDGMANSSDYVLTTALDLGIDVLRGSSRLSLYTLLSPYNSMNLLLHLIVLRL
jgi:hypothetical protein